MSDWYPDPLGRADFRRHDGTRWTHDVLTAGQESTEPTGFPLPRKDPSGEPVDPATVIAPPRPTPARRATPPRTPAYAPRPAAGGAASGLLIASGVLGIITGVITTVLIIKLLSLLSDVSRLTCNVGLPSCGQTGVDYLLGFAILGFGLLYIAAGIGACARRRWGRTILVVLGTLGTLFYLVLLIRSSDVLTLIPLLWFGTIAGLSLAANPYDL